MHYSCRGLSLEQQFAGPRNIEGDLLKPTLSNLPFLLSPHCHSRSLIAIQYAVNVMLHAALEVQVLEIVDVDVDRLEIERLENSSQLVIIERVIIG